MIGEIWPDWPPTSWRFWLSSCVKLTATSTLLGRNWGTFSATWKMVKNKKRHTFMTRAQLKKNPSDKKTNTPSTTRRRLVSWETHRYKITLLMTYCIPYCNAAALFLVEVVCFSSPSSLLSSFPMLVLRTYTRCANSTPLRGTARHKPEPKQIQNENKIKEANNFFRQKQEKVCSEKKLPK